MTDNVEIIATDTFEEIHTESVNQIRVFDEGSGWAVDGFDPKTLLYTQLVWSYDTREEAKAAITDYVEELRRVGITVSENYEVKVGQPDPDLRDE